MHAQQLIKGLVKFRNSFKIILKKGTHIKYKDKPYYAYIHSKILNGIEMYGQASDTQIKKVQKIIQNRTLKYSTSKFSEHQLNRCTKTIACL